MVVGETVGEGEAQERAVVGETPNLAARLQGLAAPGSVVISQATRRLVGTLFELTDLGPTRIKGFAEPVAAFRVEGEGSAHGRFEALHGQRLTPLIGRDHDRHGRRSPPPAQAARRSGIPAACSIGTTSIRPSYSEDHRDTLASLRRRAWGLSGILRRDRNHRHNVPGLEQFSSPNSSAPTQALRRPG